MFIVHFHIIRAYLADLFPDLYGTVKANTEYSHLYVDFFFLLSGFFLFLGKEKHKNTSWTSFMIRRLIRLYPVFAFSIILSSAIRTDIPYSTHVLDLLLMQCNGLLLVQGCNFNAWYVSSLFWGGALYFYVIKNYAEKNAEFFIALMIYASLYITVRVPVLGTDVYTSCMLRAFYGIGIGYFVGVLFSTIKKESSLSSPRKRETFAYTCIEFCVLYFIIRNAVFVKSASCNFWMFLMAFIALIWLFLIKKGMISNLCDKQVFHFCGKYAYSIYIMQDLSFRFSRKTIWCYRDFVNSHHNLAVFCGLVVSIMLGVITYHWIEKPFGTLLNRRYNAE
jgi:peptidoglycan/LPS O-acetylase OafA/YrhL